ncbi:hypothetical protein H072_6270 [Dactylellina haptotyla CBS 200.50]|uniref:Uncharacterized protein n=1 Tax=Dactylellina haptotyla (strain CBS 200.50) TaxID=1284197 RepID=S8BWT3_DACHA|nr:hypothetical protein H072_6270 [Dactylellina haptotyla CBS 200.50]
MRVQLEFSEFEGVGDLGNATTIGKMSNQAHQDASQSPGGNREINPYRHIVPRPGDSAARQVAIELERDLYGDRNVFPSTTTPNHQRAVPFEARITSIGSNIPSTDKQRANIFRSVSTAPARGFDAEVGRNRNAHTPNPLPVASRTPREATMASQQPLAEQEAVYRTPPTQPGLVTPPTRPTPVPSAPLRSTQRAKTVFRHRDIPGTPGPSRFRLEARAAMAARTAPPLTRLVYPAAIYEAQELQEASQRTTAALSVASRTSQPTYVIDPAQSLLQSPPFDFNIARLAQEEARNLPPPKLSHNISPNPIPQIQGFATSPLSPLTVDWIPQPIPLTERTQRPLEQSMNENSLFPGMRTSQRITETLQKAAAMSPTGTVIKKAPPPGIQMSHPQGTLEASPSVGCHVKKPNFGVNKPEMQSSRPQKVLDPGIVTSDPKYDEVARKRHRELDEINEYHTKQVKKRDELPGSEDLHISYTLRPDEDNFLANPRLTIPPGQERTPATYNFQAGSLTLGPPHGFTIHDKIITSFYRTAPTTTIQEVIESAEAVRDSIERIKYSMEDYHSSLSIDARELMRCELELPSEDVSNRVLPHKSSQAKVKDELMKHQRHHTTYLVSLFEDLRKKEHTYRRNLERLNRPADDPVLDPLAGIPREREKRSEEQEITYRGRLLTRAKLNELGYKGGPVQPFISQLNEDVWKSELIDVIFAADPRVLEIIQQLEKDGKSNMVKREDRIQLDGFNNTDLAAIPWGNFKIHGQPVTLPEKLSSKRGLKSLGKYGKENDLSIILPVLDELYPRSASPKSTSEDDEAEAKELDFSIMTDPGISAELKKSLNERFGIGGSEFIKEATSMRKNLPKD